IYVDRRESALVIPLQAVTMREVEVDADGAYHAPDLAQLERAREADGAAHAAAPVADARKVPKKELERVFERESEHAHFRPVKLGITGESEVEILEGLGENEELITGSYKILRTIKDGDLVRVDNHAVEIAPRKSRSRGP